MQIGWIGLGQLGAPMALRVLAARHALIAHSRPHHDRSELRAAGAKITSALTETAIGSKLVIACLYDDEQIRDAIVAGGVLAHMSPGSILVVHTTGAPKLIEELALEAPAGVDVLDAPFSGTAAAAAAGRITLMAGGRKAALDAAKPALSAYCSDIVHVGNVGDGRRVKLLNNLMFAAHVSIAKQTLIAAAQLGLDRRLVSQAISRSSGASGAFAKLSQVDDDTPIVTAMAPYLRKDVAIARRAAAAEAIVIPAAFAAAVEWER